MTNFDSPRDGLGGPATPEASGAMGRMRWALVVVCSLLALIALADLAVRAAVRLETRWDTFAYHLPFAALRGGMAIPYTMGERMALFYEGFPPLPHAIQGLLWRMTGEVNATGVVGYLAFALFLMYCHFALRARFWLVALIALTAPMVVIHATASYVDLFGNSLLAIGLASCLYIFLFTERPWRLVFCCGLAGFVGAAWSKFQLVPVVALGLVAIGLVALRRSDPDTLGWGKVTALLLVASVAAALPYVQNFIQYGNPFWPVRVPLASDMFPFAIDAVSEGIADQRPAQLRDFGQFRLFIHSFFEINHPTHYDDRARWIIDQGNALIAFRMGGFWGVGAAIFLLATIAMLVVCKRRSGIVASLGIVALLCFVGTLPQSNELRYYLFIPLLWAATIGMLFPGFMEKMPRTALLSLIGVAALFAYMASQNWEHYRIERIGYREAAADWDAAKWWTQLQRGPTYCAVDMAPIGMLLTGPSMTEFRIVDRTSEAHCPAGSIVLTKDGPQHPKREDRPRPEGEALRAAQQADAHVKASLELYRAGRYEESIAAAKLALSLVPDSAVAYNNICAANNELRRWYEAIAACSRALQIDPGFQLARNNLAWAERSKNGRTPGAATR